MTNIVQLSDLHFGSNDAYITTELQKTVLDLNPELVVVSGDLTTRARKREFIAAKEFLTSLPGQIMILPGNHDISLYNIFRRFYKPLRRFQEIIDTDVDSEFLNEEAIVIGLNSSRSFTIKGGNISDEQIQKVKDILKDAPQDINKIVVTHHPMQIMDRDILKQLRLLGVKVFVSGHMHKSGSSEEDGVIFVKAGTATSVRYRDESNSFNSLFIDGSRLTVQTYTWKTDQEKFALANKESYLL